MIIVQTPSVIISHELWVWAEKFLLVDLLQYIILSEIFYKVRIQYAQCCIQIIALSIVIMLFSCDKEYCI